MNWIRVDWWSRSRLRARLQRSGKIYCYNHAYFRIDFPSLQVFFQFVKNIIFLVVILLSFLLGCSLIDAFTAITNNADIIVTTYGTVRYSSDRIGSNQIRSDRIALVWFPDLVYLSGFVPLSALFPPQKVYLEDYGTPWSPI